MTYNKDTYVKSNSLVQATVNNLTAPQNRLMAMLLTSYVNNFDEASIEDTITLSRYDIMNYLGLSNSGQTYENMNRTIRNFFKNSIVTWIDQDRNSEKTTALFSEVEIRDYATDGDGQVTFTWNNKIKPHISNMKREYTILVTSNFLALKSKKSQSLYEFFHSYVKQGLITVPIDELKTRTECNSPAYKKFADFYKRGISDPIDEINEKTDISIEVVSKNRGTQNKKVIVSITFKITNQQAKKVWFNECPEVLLSEDEYRKVTQDFFINGLYVGKKLVYRLAETKRKKPNVIHNDFKQLEKYFKSESKKYEKLYDDEDSKEDNNNMTIYDYLVKDELKGLIANLKEGK